MNMTHHITLQDLYSNGYKLQNNLLCLTNFTYSYFESNFGYGSEVSSIKKNLKWHYNSIYMDTTMPFSKKAHINYNI